MKVWILTEEFNDYDQYGEYFRAVFSSKPNRKQLLAHEVPKDRLEHVLAGGGRIEPENSWFFLREVEAK